MSMEHEILDLIDRYWKFDNYQTPVSNWHDKQDLLEAVRKALRTHHAVGQNEQFFCQHKSVLYCKEQCYKCKQHVNN